jgi:hypothetical protein
MQLNNDRYKNRPLTICEIFEIQFTKHKIKVDNVTVSFWRQHRRDAVYINMFVCLLKQTLDIENNGHNIAPFRNYVSKVK